MTRASIDPSGRIPFYHQLVSAVAAVPGVARAGGSMAPPVGDGFNLGILDLPGALLPARAWSSAVLELADDDAQSDHAGMARHLRHGSRAGRDIDDRDTQGALPVALVNEAYAQVLTRPEPDRRNGQIRRNSAKDDRRSRAATYTYPCVMDATDYLHAVGATRSAVAGRRPMSTSAFVRQMGRPPCWHLVWRLL